MASSKNIPGKVTDYEQIHMSVNNSDFYYKETNHGIALWEDAHDVRDQVFESLDTEKPYFLDRQDEGTPAELGMKMQEVFDTDRKSFQQAIQKVLDSPSSSKYLDSGFINAISAMGSPKVSDPLIVMKMRNVGNVYAFYMIEDK